MSLVHLIRHARPAASWGEDADPGLDDLGRSQALATCERLMALPADQRPQSVVSSPLRRCLETAEPLARRLGLPIEVEADVGEIPTPSGLSTQARPAWLREAMAGSWSDIVGDIDYGAWRNAVAAAIARRPGAAVFSHFVAINAAVSLLEGDGRVVVFRPDHASVTRLGLSQGGLHMIERGPEAATGVL